MNPIATVVSVQGSAWAQSPDGTVRLLAAGDQIMADEVLIAAAGSQLVLDFGDGGLVTLTGEQAAQMAESIRAGVTVDPDESQLSAETVELLERLLGPRAEDSSQDDGDGSDSTIVKQGFGFVELARIGEQLEADGINPLRLNRVSEELPSDGVEPLAVSPVTLQGTGQPGEIYGQGNNYQGYPSHIPAPDGEPVVIPTGTVTVSVPAIDASNQADVVIGGTVEDILPGTRVDITVTDDAGNSTTVSTTVGEDLTYTVSVDVTELSDGPITADVVVIDQRGEPVEGTDTATKDTVPGTMQVQFDSVDNEAGVTDIKGSTTDVAPGSDVALVITDGAGGRIELTVTVRENGDFSVDGVDISGLEYGTLRVDAQTVDTKTNILVDDDQIDFPAPAGDITVSIDDIDPSGSIDLSGTTKNVPPGSTIEIVITDKHGNEIETSTTVNDDGSYDVPGIDVTELVDGPIEVTAKTNDPRDEEISATDNTTLDLVPGAITVNIPDIDEHNVSAVRITGTTKDVPPGSTVTVIVTDEDGTSLSRNARVKEDGSYELTVNVSRLVDGQITVDASSRDNNGDPVTAQDQTDKVMPLPEEPEPVPTPEGIITVDIPSIIPVNATSVPVTGNAFDVPPGATVTITVRDSQGGTVDVTATVGSDGRYQTSANLSSLVSGPVTATATVVDNYGQQVYGYDNGTIDQAPIIPPGSITVQFDSIDSVTATADISGNTTRVAPGRTVTLRLTDQYNNVETYSAIVQADGSFSVSGVDVSMLTDGDIRVTARVTALNGATVSDTDTGVLDAVGSSITVEMDDANADNQTSVPVKGSTQDVGPGEIVTIEITDGTDNVTVTAVVQPDGSYSTTADVSGLSNGPLDVTATTTDNNGNPISGVSTADKNDQAGAIYVDFDNVDPAALTVDIKGHTVSVDDGEVVTLVITDQAGNNYNVPGPVTVQPDGTYRVDGVDISSLIDGPLTVTATTSDTGNHVISATDNTILNGRIGEITVDIDNVDNATGLIDISGTTVDVYDWPATDEVTLTITDKNNVSVQVQTTVDSTGNYSVTGVDITSLTDGPITVTAAATDNNGNPLNATDDDILDHLVGSILVNISNVTDVNQKAVPINGTTVDVETGSIVQLEIEDQSGNIITTTATVASNGSFLINEDLSSLQNGPLTVRAQTVDNNGNTVDDTDTSVKGSSADTIVVQFDSVDDAAQTVTLSGNTNGVSTGEDVVLTISDNHGNSTQVTVQVDATGAYKAVSVDVSMLTDGPISVLAETTNVSGFPISDTDDAVLDAITGDLTITTVTVDDAGPTLDIDGSTTDVPPGSTVTIVITDKDGNTVTVTTPTDSNGDYELTGIDISTLTDGPLDIEASTTDHNGNTVEDDTTGELDHVTGDITVMLPNVNSGNETDVPIRGTTQDVPAGAKVTLVVTDQFGTTETVEATVQTDGTYLTTADLSNLEDGSLTVVASATDNNGRPVSNNDTAIKDAVAGTITVQVDNVDDATATIDLSGTTTNVEPGKEVVITITDQNGNDITVAGPVEVQADGSYAVTGVDVSSLVDGPLTIVAETVDLNGNNIDDTVNDELNALEGELTITTVTVDNAGPSLDIDGSTTDVPPGSTVTIVITDKDGNTVTVTTPTDSNGDYELTGIDISTLTDGPLDIEASTTDHNGNPVGDTETDELDHVTGQITVDLPDVNSGNEKSVPISGTTTDVQPGETVTLVITDGTNTVTVDTVVRPDGSYSTTADLSGLDNGTIDVTATTTDNNGGSINGTDDAMKNAVAGSIQVEVDSVDNAAGTLDLKGTTSNVNVGEAVTITITDQDGNVLVVPGPINVQVGGTYSIDNVDVSTLVDGPLSIVAETTDLSGNPVTDTTATVLDHVTGDLTITTVTVDDAGPTLDIDGSTTDVPPGSTVTIVITDKDGNTVTVTTPTDSNGDYELTGVDISTLTDGPLEIEASTTDHNGNTVEDDTTGELDHVTGQITVDLPDVNSGNEKSVPISGTTTDVSPGETVTLVITDGTNTVTVDTVVRADGSYTTTADLSGLDNGTIDVTATTTDNNGGSINGTDDATKDDAAPTLDITAADPDLAVGATTVVTFTFSEDVMGFDGTDINVSGGTLSNLTEVSPSLWTADFTADGSDVIVIQVDSHSYTDLLGHPGLGDSLPLNNIPVATPASDAAEDGDFYTFEASTMFSDIEPGALTYSIDPTSLPSGFTYSATTGLISGTLASDASQGGVGGVYTIVVTATDADGVSITENLELTVTNPAPVATTLPDVTGEDASTLTIPTSLAFNDPDGDVLTYTILVDGTAANDPSVVSTLGDISVDPVTGIISVDLDSSASQHGLNNDGEYVITVAVDDGQGGTVDTNFTLNVNNPAPVVSVVIPSVVVEDGSAITNIDLSSHFSDPDGDTLSYNLVSGPAWLTINANGEIEGTAPSDASQGGANSNGVYVIEVSATDDEGGTVTTTFMVTATNGAISAADDSGSTDEDVVLTVADSTLGLLNNDNSPDGDTIEVSMIGNGSVMVAPGNPIAGNGGGLFTVNADGTYSFDPNGEFDYLAAGEDATTEVTYTITDGEGGTAAATLTITVNGVNDAPVALDDINSTTEDAVLTVDAANGVLSNDTDVDATDVLTVSAVNGDTANVGTAIAGDNGGLFTLNTDGSYDFDPNGAFDDLATGESATTSITYTIDDGNGGTDTATLTVTVNGANAAPVAADDVDSTDEDTAISVDAANGVLFNDTDADGTDTLTVTQITSGATTVIAGVAIAGTNGGLFTIHADGSYDFDPNGEFEYLADGESATTEVTYTVDDGNGGTDTATLTVTVNGVNDAPVAVNDINSTAEDAVLNVDAANGVLSNDTDVDATDVLTVSAVNGDAANVGTAIAGDNGGLFTLNTDGSYDFDPNGAFDNLAAGESATTSITYTIDDGNGGTDTATLTVTVNGANAAPVAADDVDSTDEDTAISVDAANGVLFNDTDADGTDTLTVTQITSGATTVIAGVAIAGTNGGLFTIHADGSYDFDPNGDFDYLANGESATTEVTYTVDDGNGGTDTATLTITVDGVNDTPEVVATLPDLAADDATTITIPTGSAFFDADTSDTLTYSVSVVGGDETDLGVVNIDPATGEITVNLDSSASQHGVSNNGVYTLEVTADDGNGGTISTQFDITVSNPIPTVIPQTGLTAEDGELFELDVTTAFTDPDGDELTFTIDPGDLPTGLTYDPITKMISGTLGTSASQGGPGSDGVYHITIIADDGEGGVVSDIIDLAVTNPAPVFSALPNVTFLDGDVLDDSDPAAEDGIRTAHAFTDPDGDTLTYSATGLPEGLSIDATTGVISGTLLPNASAGGDAVDGKYTIVVTADDGEGGKTTGTFELKVNIVPVIPTDTPATVDEAGLPGIGSDPDSDREIAAGHLNLQSGWTVQTAQNGTATNGIWSVATDGTFTYTLTSPTADGVDDTDTFTYTAVDPLGNTVTNTVTIAIIDDTPEIDLSGAALPPVQVDETTFGTPVTEDYSGAFGTPVYGADGAAAANSLIYSLIVNNSATSFTDTATGEDIVLVDTSGDGSLITGQVSGGVDDGEAAFTISVDADGEVTLTQLRALSHPVSGDPDDVLTLANGALSLTATVTDGDGDTDSASIVIGDRFSFRDDGPTVGAPPAATTVQEAHLSTGSSSTGNPVTATADLNVDLGADNGTLVFTSAQPALEAMLTASGNGDITFSVDGTGTVLTATRGGSPVFTVSLSVDGSGQASYEFTLHDSMKHLVLDTHALTFNYQAIDGDGDLAPGSFTVNVTDDKPEAEDDIATVTGGSYDPVSGNVIAGTGTGDAADTSSADGVRVTQVAFNGTTVTPPADNTDVVINGDYGQLTIRADGTYTYVRDSSGTSGDVFDQFIYTLTDGDNDSDTATLTIDIENALPEISNLTPQASGGDAVVDESNLPQGTGVGTAGVTATGDFTISAPDGIAELSITHNSVTYDLIIDNVTQVLPTITTALGNTLTITSYTPSTGVIEYSYTLNDDEMHGASGRDDLFEDFTINLEDLDGDKATDTLSVRIIDDIPVITQNTADSVSLTVDESDLATDANGDFSVLFDVDHGADGMATTNALTYKLEAGAVASGLVDTLSGDDVVLTANVDNTVITGTADGETVLVITIDPTTGEVELDQQRAVHHDDDTNHNDEARLDEGSVTIVATAIDGDGDEVESRINIGHRFGFLDDGPSITTTAGAAPVSLTVYDSQTASGTSSATQAYAAAFAVGAKDAGADGEQGVTWAYSLGLQDDAAFVASGLSTGEAAITLYLIGGEIVGSTAANAGGVAAGNTAFTIVVNADGDVTLTQFLPIDHPTGGVDPVNHAETLSMATGLITLTGTATITDGDGDTASDSTTINIGDKFVFTDHGPAIDSPEDGTVYEAGLPNGSDPTKAVQVSGSLDVEHSADGSDVHFTADTIAELEALNLESDSTPLTYALSNENHTITATSGSNTIFTVVITDPTTADASYTFTLHGPLDHAAAVDEHELKFMVVTVTDNDDDTAIGEFTVIVVDDQPAENVSYVVEEDHEISFVTTADSTPGNTGISQGGSELTGNPNSEGGIDYTSANGLITVNANGSITYTPNENYSGQEVFDYLTDADEGATETTVTITVTPVADAPTLPVNAVNINTLEDTAVKLGLNAPVIVDNTDQNGDGTPGDWPERLGAIELSGLPAGAVLTYGGNLYTVNATGQVTIQLTDLAGGDHDSGEGHLSGLTTDLSMTIADFESMTVTPPPHSHENFTVTMSVTSYEVDATGNIIEVDVNGTATPVPGATSTAQVNVRVQAVTDDVELTFDTAVTSGIHNVDGVDYSGNTIADVRIKEDTDFRLNDILRANFVDLDGSEKRSITIENTTGQTILVNGTSLASGASRTFDAKSGANGQTGEIDSFPNIDIGAEGDFSGDLEGIIVTINAQDIDGDGWGTGSSPGNIGGLGVAEDDTSNNSVTLNLRVTPVAGDVNTSSSYEINEDEAVAFLSGIEVTDGSSSAGHGEIITKISFTIPTDTNGTWTVHKPTAGEGSAWEVTETVGTYTITALGATNLQDVLSDFTIQPPAHSSLDASIPVHVTSVDSELVDGTTYTSDSETKTHNVAITVNPVAEVIDPDGPTWGEPGDDLTMTPGHHYVTAGEEDKWFDLGSEGTFNLKDGWSNQDVDEITYARLTPELIDGDGARVNARGSQFQWDGSDGPVTFNGTAIDVPITALDSLEFKAARNFSGMFRIKVQAYTVDYDDDTEDAGTPATAESGEAMLTNVLIAPVADQVTLAVTGVARGNEDDEIKLQIRPHSSDPSETFEVTISDIPEGATMTYDGVVQIVTGGELTIENFSRTAPLTIKPPLDSNEDFTLKVNAVSVDTLELPGENPGDPSIIHKHKSDPLAQPLNIEVQVRGVPDEPVFVTATHEVTEQVVDSEDVVDGDGFGMVALKNLVTGLASGETVTPPDGSESVRLYITGLPDGIGLNNADFLGKVGGEAPENRAWLVSEAQLADTKLTLPTNFSGTLEFQVKPVVTENDGRSTKFGSSTVTLKVTPSPEAELTEESSLLEDTRGKVDFSLVHQNGDTDETLASVWINKAQADSGTNFKLYLDATELKDTSLETRTEGGQEWYVLTGADIDNVYAQGAPNAAGVYSFNVKYEVTDPSQDGMLDPVTVLFDGTHTLNIAAVTDPATLVITSITTTDPGDASIDGVTGAEVNSATDVTVNLHLTKDEDSAAGGARDYDGSERIVEVRIDGVPDGVIVKNAHYIGNIADGEGGTEATGRWVMELPEAERALIAPYDFAIVFNLAGSTNLMDWRSADMIVTVVTEDDGAQSPHPASTSWTLSLADDFSTDVTPTPPAVIDADDGWRDNPDFVAKEDVQFSLADAVVAEISGSSDFSVTITNFPAGTIITGMNETSVNGQAVWTAHGEGDNAALQTLLSAIQITLPADWNNNKLVGGGSYPEFHATLTTQSETGDRDVRDIVIVQPVEPVTDPSTIVIDAPGVNEGSDVVFTVEVSNPQDGDFSEVIGDGLYLQISADVDMQGGTLMDSSENPLTSVVDPEGLPAGTYYLLADINAEDTVNIIYRPPQHGSGEVTLETWLRTREEGAPANNIETGHGSASAVVTAQNSGYSFGDLDEFQDVLGVEDGGYIELPQSGGGLVDLDGSESVQGALLKNVPDDFLVVYGSDAGSATLASNAGDGIWSIPTAGGKLPGFIALVPPQYYNTAANGPQQVSLVVMTKEQALSEVAESTQYYDITVTPIANGLTINPTPSFGPEGDRVSLNLNSAVLDAKEQVTLVLESMGEHAAFYTEGTLLNAQPGKVTYDPANGGTYTLTGLNPDDVDGLEFVQAAAAITSPITVSAYTADGAEVSSTITADVNLQITRAVPTNGNDELFYISGTSLNGLAGDDTVKLRYEQDLGSSDYSYLKNIENIDLSMAGANSVSDLTLADVLGMTDENNELTIFGNSADSIYLGGTPAEGWQLKETTGGFRVYENVSDPTVIVRIEEFINTSGNIIE